jgi:hypothetical protein
MSTDVEGALRNGGYARNASTASNKRSVEERFLLLKNISYGHGENLGKETSKRPFMYLCFAYWVSGIL